MAICCSASQRERATESVPPRACHLERSAPPSAAGVGCGWCSGAVIEQQAPARHAECTRDASRVHALLVQRQTASASAEKGARADSCTPATARAAQRECWLTSGRLTVLGQPGSPSARAAASDTTSSQGDAFFRGRRGSFPPRGGVRRRPRRAPAALETSRRPGRALTRRDDLGEARRRARSFTVLTHSCERCQSGVSTPISFKENADSKSAVHTSQVSVSGAAE